MGLSLNQAIRVANQAVSLKFSKELTDVEIIVFRGAWEREEYDQIAAKCKYTTSYISQDVAPKLWKTLTTALGEKVKKSNFKEALRRYAEKQSLQQEDINHEYHPNSWELINLNQELPEFQLGEATSAATTTVIPLSSDQLDFQELEYYVERHPIENLCYENLLQPGSLVRIKAPQLMGKTTLMERILAKLGKQDYRTVSLSLEMADRQTHFTNLNKFLRWFCLYLSRELNLLNQLDKYWDEEGIGAKVSCTTYLEEYLLAASESPLVLYLDDVDVLFPYPEVYEDFFGLLRSWYEKARSRPTWKKLRLAIAHATDVYIRLNIHQSPFNVGLPIELPELTREEVIVLAKQYNLGEDIALIDQLMQLVGGHPYLLKQSFSYLKSYPDTNLDKLLLEGPTDAGIYRDHLRKYWLSLQQEPKLMAAFQIVVIADQPVRLEIIPAYQLQSMGLVKLVGNEVEARCKLYRSYFRDILNHTQKQ